MTGELTNHLWQSTMFAVAAGLLTVGFRKNRAQVRFWLWFSGSLKFLVPFSLLTSLASHLQWAPVAQKIATETVSSTMVQIAQPFAAASFAPSAPRSVDWVPIAILVVWACGFTALSLVRLRAWLRIQRPVGQTIVFSGLSSCPIRSVPGLLEPGVIGVFRPTLLLPEGIAERLTPPQLQAVLAHELCHVRRRDNLFASIHMIVEAVFWFHPLVWWIGARLVEERERACDEEVLRQGSEPHVYAEAILNVCKLYVESPLECVSGVTGANLRHRIEAIMANRTAQRLNRAKKFLLATAGVVALAVPFAIGVAHTSAIRAQSQAAKPLAFDAASIKPNNSGGGGRKGPGGGSLRITPPGRVFSRGVSARKIIEEAYHLTQYQVSGGPGWIASDMFSLEAKTEIPSTDKQLRQMLQTLLAERFQLVGHRETKEMPVYILTVGKNGLKVPELKEGDPTPTVVRREGITAGPAMIFRNNMQGFAEFLSGNPNFDRPVVDKTGLQRDYFFGLQWSEDEDFITVMQQEFGLKLESRKVPMDILVIDRIEKPSKN